MNQRIQVTFPDETRRTFEHGITVAEVLTHDQHRGDRRILAAEVDGIVKDLSTVLTHDASVKPVTFDTPAGKEVFWHTSAHVMAQAVKRMFPRAKLAIGPPIEHGFYYDFDFERPFTPEDLRLIEEHAREITKADYPITRMEHRPDEAIRLFGEQGERLKVEIIEGIDESCVSMYRQGEFVDLCRGPHVPSTGYIGAFKLLSGAGAYWRGDERNSMLQRIYGTAFPTQEELDQYLHHLEEAKRRDHRKLGKELELFSIQETLGPGLILWHPKGARVRLLIENFWKDEHLARGYDLVYSPHVARVDLWQQSGHLEFYKDYMFAPIAIEGTPYQLKPMNCPFHIAMYKSRLRSYRELPLRWAELGTVYRYERSGVLHGLLRVRGFTQDDAHIFCRPEQLGEEVGRIIEFTFSTLRRFGFEQFETFLSTRPEQFVGSDHAWQQSTSALESALRDLHVEYSVDSGEGVFYGPKIDIKIRDVLGRAWQCSTIQVDFNLPERFGLAFAGPDGKLHQPIMIHRAILGSIERFVGILIEHYAGAFPFWLAPIQIAVLPLADSHHGCAREVESILTRHGYRVECDVRSEKIGLKIREAETAKIPYMAVLGEREVNDGTVSVRKRRGERLGTKSIEQFLAILEKEQTSTQ